MSVAANDVWKMAADMPKTPKNTHFTPFQRRRCEILVAARRPNVPKLRRSGIASTVLFFCMAKVLLNVLNEQVNLLARPTQRLCNRQFYTRMSNTIDKRLSFKPYRQVLERVQIQFDLIRFSMKALKEKDQKEFFKQVAEKKLSSNEKYRTFLKQHKLFSDEEADQMADERVKKIKSELRQENRAGNLLVISEFSEDRLNQSELLLLVAHFESFMKLVHEAFLHAAPGKVFGKSFRDEQNPKIPLKDIFDSTQSSSNTRKFLNELVAKEVKWLDAQNIEVKADYFAKHFGISFGKAEEIETLKKIMKRRNEISHEIYEPPKNHDEMLKETLEQGKERPLVLEPMLAKARELFFWIPQKCIESGGKIYQSNFKNW
jgi:hypothetical protein